MNAGPNEDRDLDDAFRGLDLAAGGPDDIRRTVLNQRDQLIGAEAELATARRRRERLEEEVEVLKVQLHRAQRWPFGWIRSGIRRSRAIFRRLSRMAP